MLTNAIPPDFRGVYAKVKGDKTLEPGLLQVGTRTIALKCAGIMEARLVPRQHARKGDQSPREHHGVNNRNLSAVLGVGDDVAHEDLGVLGREDPAIFFFPMNVREKSGHGHVLRRVYEQQQQQQITLPLIYTRYIIPAV